VLIRLLGTGLVLLVVVFAWVKVGQLFHASLKPAPPVRATAIAWGGRVFSDGGELRRWLAGRGGSYAAFARRYPGAYAVLEGLTYRPRVKHRAAVQRNANARSAEPRRQTAAARASVTPAASSASHRSATLAAAMIAAIAALALTLAVLPGGLVVRVSPGVARVVVSTRVYFAAVGLSVLIGALAALRL